MLRANSCLTFSFRVQKAVVHTQSPESLARFPFLWMIWVSANSNGGDGAENERHLSTSGLCNKKKARSKRGFADQFYTSQSYRVQPNLQCNNPFCSRTQPVLPCITTNSRTQPILQCNNQLYSRKSQIYNVTTNSRTQSVLQCNNQFCNVTISTM